MDPKLRTSHGYATIDGMRLHWVEMGTGTRVAPVVLLHGISDSHLTWSLVAPLLAKHGRVLMPDLLGCGLSDRPDASYELAWHARVIGDWLAHIGVASADIVGHSFGGGVAQMLLLQCPTRVRRLALVAPGGLGRGVGHWLRLAASVPRMVELFGQPFMALGTRLALQGPPFSDDEIMALSAMNATDGTARAFARTAQDVINWRGQSRSFLQRAEELQTLPPIAVFWGDRDAMISIDHGAAFAQAVSGVLFRPFPGCGHYLHCEEPQTFARALRAFLDHADAEAPCLRIRQPVRKRRNLPAWIEAAVASCWA